MKQINQINQINLSFTFKLLLIIILSLMLFTANSNLLKKSSMLKENKSQNNNKILNANRGNKPATWCYFKAQTPCPGGYTKFEGKCSTCEDTKNKFVSGGCYPKYCPNNYVNFQDTACKRKGAPAKEQPIPKKRFNPETIDFTCAKGYILEGEQCSLDCKSKNLGFNCGDRACVSKSNACTHKIADHVVTNSSPMCKL